VSVKKHLALPSAVRDQTFGDAEPINPMDQFIGYKIRRLQHVIIAELNEILRAFDLRVMDFAILCIVDSNPGLHQNAIARLIGAEPPAVVLSLDRLERAGHLWRQPGEDRRLRTLRLTAEGRHLHKKVVREVEEQERRIARAVRHDIPGFIANLDGLMLHYGI
jgi:DNA-binding MarR family transcriptional regulator